jgi:hypothetical protein
MCYGVLQERMSQNHVYVFAKKAPTKFSFIAEIKSCPDSGETPRARLLLSISHPSLPVIRFQYGMTHAARCCSTARCTVHGAR